MLKIPYLCSTDIFPGSPKGTSEKRPKQTNSKDSPRTHAAHPDTVETEKCWYRKDFDGGAVPKQDVNTSCNPDMLKPWTMPASTLRTSESSTSPSHTGQPCLVH